MSDDQTNPAKARHTYKLALYQAGEEAAKIAQAYLKGESSVTSNSGKMDVAIKLLAIIEAGEDKA